jgi:hypothetical protein
LEERRRHPFLSAEEQHKRLAHRLKKGTAGRRGDFAGAEDLLKGFWRQAGLAEDRVAILHAIWDREVGSFKMHWILEGVKRGTVHIRVKSSASAQELSMRSRELVRSLNKHFRSAWIKQIRFRVGSALK